jgi:hypothetical protein
MLEAVHSQIQLELRGMRLESVASGYWTLILNQSSGFVSH